MELLYNIIYIIAVASIAYLTSRLVIDYIFLAKEKFTNKIADRLFNKNEE